MQLTTENHDSEHGDNQSADRGPETKRVESFTDEPTDTFTYRSLLGELLWLGGFFSTLSGCICFSEIALKMKSSPRIGLLRVFFFHIQFNKANVLILRKGRI